MLFINFYFNITDSFRVLILIAYPVPQNYPTQQGPTHVPNQTQIPPQPQYPISGVQQQQAHSSQPIQHVSINIVHF